MADTIIPVQLNKGLDLVTPQLLADQGALIDCLNYELTDIAGVRRIDGYERFDGYPDGDIGVYYQLTIEAAIPAFQASITPGAILLATVVTPPDVIVVGDPATDDVGVIVGTGPGTNVYRFVPFGGQTTITAGLAIKIRDTAGGVFDATVTVAPVLGSTIDTDVNTYLANMRAYSSVLRGLVTSTPSKIAGIWRLDDELYAAIDAYDLQFVYTNTSVQPVVGQYVRHKGMIYRLLGFASLPRGSTPVPREVRMILQPITTATINDDNVVECLYDSTAITTMGTTTTAATLTSDYAYVVRYNEVRDTTVRGTDYLDPIVRIPFDAGTYSSEFFPLNTTVTITPPDSFTVDITGILRGYEITSGSFLTNNATGYLHVELGVAPNGGSRILDNYYVRYDTTILFATVNTASESIQGPKYAGTSLLRFSDTRYVAIQANFTGNIGTRAAYVANGACRAGWNTRTGFGNVWTNTDSSLDIPKYLAFHAGKLALGFAQGSVILSVQGEPLNYSGLDGAIEIATGDPVTGMLELPGETLAVFGKRAIRKITGFTDTDTVLGSLASGSCFDYTAVLVGQTAVYTGTYGITSLGQSSAYGDFVGERLSDKIAFWLRPKLISSYSSIEDGGVVCAFACRNKQQYRLFLKTGEVVFLTLTEEGPRMTLVNYGGKIPFAWSSDVLDNGQERLHVRWDATGDEYLTYSLDKGWGFDGQQFEHYFDLAHFFNKHGTQYMGIEKVRLYGQGYGIATLDVKSAGVETDFDQGYHTTIQDISMPPVPYTFYDRMKPVTSLIDQANWGTGIKLRIGNDPAPGATATEPSHICQVLVMHMRTEGAGDN